MTYENKPKFEIICNRCKFTFSTFNVKDNECQMCRNKYNVSNEFEQLNYE